MSKGNEWTVRDIIQSLEKDREIYVHKTISSHKGLRDRIKEMLTQKVVKEVHQNEDYKFYQLTSLAKPSQSRSKQRRFRQ